MGSSVHGHPGEDGYPGLEADTGSAYGIDILMIASAGFADVHGLLAALALVKPTASTWARGSRALAESAIHQKAKEATAAGTELDTELIFRSLGNTARVASNAVHAR